MYEGRKSKIATTKILSMSEPSSGGGSHLKNSIGYIENSSKTQGGTLVEYINCDEGTAYEEMMETKKQFGKEGGRQGYHIIISYKPGEVDAETGHKISMEFAKMFFENKYEVVCATHDDKKHIHTHLVFNSVSLQGGKYRYERGDWARVMQPITNHLTSKYGLSTISINTQGNNMAYNMWLDMKNDGYTYRDIIMSDIDNIVSVSFSLGDFIVQMKELGYEVELNENRTDIKFKLPIAKRFIRASSLDKGYSLDGIMERMGLPIYNKARRYKYRKDLIKWYGKKLMTTQLQRQVWVYKKKLGLLKRPVKEWGDKDSGTYRQAKRKLEYIQDKKLRTIEQVNGILDDLKKKESYCVTRRVAIYRAKKRFAAAFEKLEQYELLKYDAEMFENGDYYFETGHKKCIELKRQIELTGMPVEALRAKLNDYEAGLKEVRDELRQIHSEKRICEQIKKDYEETRKTKERQEQQKQKRNVNLSI